LKLDLLSDHSPYYSIKSIKTIYFGRRSNPVETWDFEVGLSEAKLGPPMVAIQSDEESQYHALPPSLRLTLILDLFLYSSPS